MPTAAATLPEPAVDEAFERLFRDHHAFVYRTAYSVTGRRQDAEDVVQTIFLRLLRRGLPEDVRENPKGYLHRAAVNVSLNVVRARKRQRTTSSVEALRVIAPVADADPGDEMRGRLIKAMGDLRPRVVEMLVLRYEHDYSDADIARILGTSRGVVAVTLYRARARLKKALRAPAGEQS
jgi:RNA polymerase sigma-70 factor (ECF subfamily)